MLYETEALDWNDVKDFFHKDGCVVVGDPELKWYKESWNALIKSNLASEMNLEKPSHVRTILKLRAICLLAMYMGIYQEAGEFSDLGGYFSGHPPFPWYLESLKVELEDLWEIGHMHEMLETESSTYWEDEETSESDLESIGMELVREENHDIYEILHRHYGGDIGLFTSIWNSRKLSDEIGPALEHLVNTRHLFGRRSTGGLGLCSWRHAQLDSIELRCEPVGWGAEEHNPDEEALQNMRTVAEMMAGKSFRASGPPYTSCRPIRLSEHACGAGRLPTGSGVAAEVEFLAPSSAAGSVTNGRRSLAVNLHNRSNCYPPGLRSRAGISPTDNRTRLSRRTEKCGLTSTSSLRARPAWQAAPRARHRHQSDRHSVPGRRST